MVKSETERLVSASEPQPTPAVQPESVPVAPVQAAVPAPTPVGAMTVAEPAAPVAEPQPQAELAGKLRAEFAEIASIAAQAARLGVSVDAADAMRKGISADALRRGVLDALAARAEATSVIAAAPSTPAAVDSPIVRIARKHATEARA